MRLHQIIYFSLSFDLFLFLRRCRRRRLSFLIVGANIALTRIKLRNCKNMLGHTDFVVIFGMDGNEKSVHN